MLTLTIRTSAVNQSESARVPPAPPAVIARRAEQKLIPAVLAKIRIRFTDALLAVDADRRPK